MARGTSSVMANRHVQRRKRKMLQNDSSNQKERCISQYLRTGNFIKICYPKKYKQIQILNMVVILVTR